MLNLSKLDIMTMHFKGPNTLLLLFYYYYYYIFKELCNPLLQFFVPRGELGL